MQSRFTNPLEHVRVAAPCTADWDKMQGNERVRFCDKCSYNVYNLSEMTRREAEALITRAEGRLCVRFYRRADGTILTRNCPVGLRALKRRVSRVANAVASALLTFLTGLGLYGLLREGKPSHTFQGVVSEMRSEDALPEYTVTEGQMELALPNVFGARNVEDEPVLEVGKMRVEPAINQVMGEAYVGGRVEQPVKIEPYKVWRKRWHRRNR